MAETCLELEKKVEKTVSEKKLFQGKATCLNRILGRCRNCAEDYNPEHHPNNLDCPNYQKGVVHIFYVQSN